MSSKSVPPAAPSAPPAPGPRPLLAFFGHHKCASTWTHSIVDWVCADAGWKLAYLYDEKPFGDDPLDALRPGIEFRLRQFSRPGLQIYGGSERQRDHDSGN